MKNKTIGIDAGGSLLKVAYEEHGHFHFRKYPIIELDKAMSWIKLLAPNARYMLTGGKSGIIQSTYLKEGTIIPEFEAACSGAVYFLKKLNLGINKFLLVNIGTGTSFFKIDGEQYDRLLGTGVGGGTFMGLGSLLAKANDFGTLVKLSGEGDKGNVDLLVKDIYAPQEPPIEGSLTASNFAKAGLGSTSTTADQMASVTNMIAETIILLSMQAASIHNLKSVVFIGTTLAGNIPLEKSLMFYSNMLGLQAIFLENGEFSGAVGALLKN